MSCGKWTNSILGIVILLVTIWPTMFSAMTNKWIVIIAAILLVIHACCCKNCGMCGHEDMSKKKRR